MEECTHILRNPVCRVRQCEGDTCLHHDFYECGEIFYNYSPESWVGMGNKLYCSKGCYIKDVLIYTGVRNVHNVIKHIEF